MTGLTSIDRLKRLCREKEVNLKEGAKGHFIIEGDVYEVHYWPQSKNRTAFVKGSGKGIPNINVAAAVRLATKGRAYD